MRDLVIGDIGLLILTATLVVRSLHRWQEHSKRSRSGAPLIAEGLTAAVFFAYSYATESHVFAAASGLVLASAVVDYLALRITRRRASRRELVRMSSWLKAPHVRRAEFIS